jgi:arylsulfatase A-like enzyme
MKRLTSCLGVLAGVAFAAAGTSSLYSATGRPPNVIVILADDLGYGDLGVYGHPRFKTPHLDRLASEGARLMHFHAPAPYCGPTRASLLTGRYPFHHGLTGNPAPDAGPNENMLHLPESEVLLPQLLGPAGYATGMVGKWHIGHANEAWWPTQRGFGEFFGILYSNDMRPVQHLEGNRVVEYPVIQANTTKRYTERAIDFIQRNRSRPFFLYLAHVMPHKPLAASEEFYKKSGAGLYGDVMAELDWGVGQIMAKLDELRLAEDTLLIFTSDNGPSSGGSTGGLRGSKASSYEGGYRVPFIARWPGRIPRGHVNHSPAIIMDLFTTVLTVARVAPPVDRVIDGRDLMPLLTSHASSSHEVIFGHLGADVAMVRDARWKLHLIAPRDSRLRQMATSDTWVDPRGPDGVTILAPYEQYRPIDHPGVTTGDPPAAMQLFDLQADPGEQRDVSRQHPEVVERLRRSYEAYVKGGAAAVKPAAAGKAARTKR